MLTKFRNKMAQVIGGNMQNTPSLEEYFQEMLASIPKESKPSSSILIAVFRTFFYGGAGITLKRLRNHCQSIEHEILVGGVDAIRKACEQLE